MEVTKTKIQLAEEYRELFNPKWRYIVYHGGRGSLKSHSVARAILIRGRQSKLRILCTRELQKSIKDSVHKLLSDLIEQYELTDYVILKDSITNTVTGTEILFTGIRNNTNEIKSMEGIDICWVEEAQSITEESINVLTPTIRKPGSQIIFTFNRLTELDPVYVRFVVNKPTNTYAAQVNYDVALREGWLPDVLQQEMEDDKQFPDLFSHKWLGEPISQVDNAIIDRDKAREAMNRTVSDEGAEEVGVDVARMGNDRSTFYKRKGFKVTGHQEHSKTSLTDLATRLEHFINFNKQVRIKIDDTGVGGGLTDIMKERGYSVVAINFGSSPTDKDRYTNLISEAWFHLQTIIDKIQLPLDNDLLMELTTRKWRMDSRGRRAVESKEDYKKRGYRSPDKADGLIMCYYNPEVLSYDDLISFSHDIVDRTEDDYGVIG